MIRLFGIGTPIEYSTPVARWRALTLGKVKEDGARASHAFMTFDYLEVEKIIYEGFDLDRW